jgi:hypothetical protein
MTPEGSPASIKCKKKILNQIRRNKYVKFIQGAFEVEAFLLTCDIVRLSIF